MKNALSLSHDYLDQLIERFPRGVFIDGTLGNGHDSHYILSHHQFKGLVVGFDIQEAAITQSKKRLESFATHQYLLFHASHDLLNQKLDKDKFPYFHGAIFNLGYLPGGNHQITTHYDSTYRAIQQIAARLVPKGQIILVIYSGHRQGADEKNFLLDQLSTWSQEIFHIAYTDYLNQKNNPPCLIIIEKRK